MSMKELRWYPKEWRARNAEAVEGVLQDLANDNGGLLPRGERRALVVGGIRERYRLAFHGRRLRYAALVMATVFGVWYSALITWSPGSWPDLDGAALGFSNTAFVAAALATAGLVAFSLTFARVGAALAAAAALWMLGLGVVADISGWLGPSAVPVIMLAGLCLVAAGVFRSTLANALALALIPVLAGVPIGVSFVGAWTSPVDGVDLPATVAVAAIVAGILAKLAIDRVRGDRPTRS